MGWKGSCEISISGEGQGDIREGAQGKYLFDSTRNNKNSSLNMASWFSCHKNPQQLSQLELRPPASSDTYIPRSLDSNKQYYQPTTIPTSNDIPQLTDPSKRHDLIYDIQTPSKTLPLHQHLLYQHYSSQNSEPLNQSDNFSSDLARPIARPVLMYVTSDKKQNNNDNTNTIFPLVSKFHEVQCNCNKDVDCRCFELNKCQSYLKSN